MTSSVCRHPACPNRTQSWDESLRQYSSRRPRVSRQKHCLKPTIPAASAVFLIVSILRDWDVAGESLLTQVTFHPGKHAGHVAHTRLRVYPQREGDRAPEEVVTSGSMLLLATCLGKGPMTIRSSRCVLASLVATIGRSLRDAPFLLARCRIFRSATQWIDVNG